VGEDVWNSYYKFTIVRNPFDRLHSLWWNSRYMGKHHEFELPEFAEYYLEQSLMGRIRGLLAGRRRMHERFWPQYEFVVSANGKMEMDYVIRFENINEDFAVVADRLGLPSLEAPKILHKNRNPKSRRSYVEDYNDRARDFVSEVYRDDIREFGYTFGE